MKLKAATSELDYPITYTLEEGETISTSTWAVSPVEVGGVEVKAATPAIDGAATSCILKGGIAGHLYEVTNTIVTNQGRTDVLTATFRVGNVEAVA